MPCNAMQGKARQGSCSDQLRFMEAFRREAKQGRLLMSVSNKISFSRMFVFVVIITNLFV